MIRTHVLAWWSRHQVRSLGVYWPIRSEPDLTEMYAELSERGVQLALPIVVDQDAPLQFAAWSPGAHLVKDSFGVSIPADLDRKISPEALLIPCVGFNDDNIRLGYGGGFYDRTLARQPRPLAIGIAYRLSRTSFTAGPHDVPLDLIVTE